MAQDTIRPVGSRQAGLSPPVSGARLYVRNQDYVAAYDIKAN